MATDAWGRATFAGTSRAQADRVSRLSADERLALLEQLLALAADTGALQRSRAEKQAAIDRLWTPSADDVSADERGEETATPQPATHADTGARPPTDPEPLAHVPAGGSSGPLGDVLADMRDADDR